MEEAIKDISSNKNEPKDTAAVAVEVVSPAAPAPEVPLLVTPAITTDDSNNSTQLQVLAVSIYL